jgi:predicted flap endonuclease-1-like 5' DNA nuclease
MGLIGKIKRALGLGDDPPDGEAEGTRVTVERGSDADGAESSTGDGGTDAGAGTASTTTETDDVGVSHGEGEAEPDEEEEAPLDTAADDSDSEPADDGSAEAGDAEDDEPDGEPVERIKGIGPAYGERLGDVGIETVGDLAAADPAAVAEETSVGEKRATTWIERAREF